MLSIGIFMDVIQLAAIIVWIVPVSYTHLLSKKNCSKSLINPMLPPKIRAKRDFSINLKRSKKAVIIINRTVTREVDAVLSLSLIHILSL